MKREILEKLANQWVELVSKDLQEDVFRLMEETEASIDELAYSIGMDSSDLRNIIEGHCENIDIYTFGLLMIVLGKRLKVENVESKAPTPKMPTMEEIHHRKTPFGQENVFTREHRTRPLGQMGRRVPIQDGLGIPFTPIFYGGINEEEPKRVQPQNSKFANFPREKLVHIIKKFLWDSEIDVVHSSYNDLVSFLNEKDRQMKEFKEEEDPKVSQFKERARRAIQDNPNLEDFIHKILCTNDLLGHQKA